MCFSECVFAFTLVLLSNSLCLCNPFLPLLFSSSGEKDPGNSQVPASQKPLSARRLQWNKDCLSVGMLMRNLTQTVMATVWQLGTLRRMENRIYLLYKPGRWENYILVFHSKIKSLITHSSDKSKCRIQNIIYSNKAQCCKKKCNFFCDNLMIIPKVRSV